MADETKNQAQQKDQGKGTTKPLVKSPIALREEKTLAFWKSAKIFEKSMGEIGNDAPHGADKGEYVFYDGPPFATGMPHFGHVLPTSIKDAIPRYKTMQGYHVRRRWGWDCHGLPVENLVEKELGLKAKKDIIDYGIGRFNEAARAAVNRYKKEWCTIIPRLGRWADMDHDYETMDATYTESVWWAFKNLHDKGLIYEGFKSMQLCPRCETTLSNFEVNQGYKDITDISVYVKFELADEPNTYMLAWTTTPWTLPGNVALAVNQDIPYVRVEMTDEPGKPKVIFAKELLEKMGKVKGGFNIVSVTSGKNLVGKSYKPIFDYYSKNTALKDAKNGWKIYAADFVATTEGTGIVHIAPAFGAEDMELGKKHHLPFIQHVGTDGKFKKEVTDFAGQSVKPRDTEENKDAHQSGDVAVIKYLSMIRTDATGKPTQTSPALFAKEKITHPYAHCWRCETPLLNYAASSWFVKVTDIKDRLVAENKKVAWVPEDVGLGRFGNWLLGARDWAISRSRFWGAPLPVWRTVEDEAHTKEDEKIKSSRDLQPEPHHEPQTVVIGSLADLKKYSHANNTYYVMRHGQAENNIKNIISSKAETPHHLTETGKKQVVEAVRWLADKKIDLIYVSPFVRTVETAEIVAKHLGIPTDASAGRVIIEPTIGELNAGDYNGMDFHEFIAKFPFDKRFDSRPPNGESYADIKKRMGDFLYSLEKKHSEKEKIGGKNILIITHDSPAYLLAAAAQGLNQNEALALRGASDHFINNATPFLLDFTPLPHNKDYELDLHRPYIDEVELKTPDGRHLVRVPEVFDCWFESGSMPFAEAHYPFATASSDADFDPIGKKSGLFAKKKTSGYPADFIAEAQDQTRGWFYSMLVLGVALFNRAPYKNVIVNGLVLAEDGNKLSKHKGNFPDLMLTVDKYGADALRFYLLSSPLVRAQESCFSERGVDEVAKKHIGRLSNIVSFYEMYAIAEESRVATATVVVPIVTPKSTHVIDVWIMARLSELVFEVTKGLEAYELDRATRPFADFIDDFSTWYIRRSRDRFKNMSSTDNVADVKSASGDKVAALAVTRFVLFKTAKLLAPFMPFLAEDIYTRVHGGKESVHLENWAILPPNDQKKKDVLLNMREVRRVVTLALEARMKAKVNVRQPLAKLTVTSSLFEDHSEFHADYIALIRDEVNVKEVVIHAMVESSEKKGNVDTNDRKLDADTLELDTAITPALKAEGNFRELTRAIQDLRKGAGLTIADIVNLQVKTDYAGKHFIENKKIEIMKTTGLKGIVFVDTSADTTVDATVADVRVEDAREVTIDEYHFTISFKK